MSEHTQEYTDYLKSTRWAITRAAAIKRVGGRCQMCSSSCRLEVHHRTYNRLGKELPEDLLVVCGTCHKIEDRRRREEVARRNAAALQDARVNGWATKKYGEDWWRYHDQAEVEEEFEEWLVDRLI